MGFLKINVFLTHTKNITNVSHAPWITNQSLCLFIKAGSSYLFGKCFLILNVKTPFLWFSQYRIPPSYSHHNSMIKITEYLPLWTQPCIGANVIVIFEFKCIQAILFCKPFFVKQLFSVPLHYMNNYSFFWSTGFVLF